MTIHNPRDMQLSLRRPSAAPVAQADMAAIRTIHTGALFGRQREVLIDHHGTQYRLKITRQGKLILNK